MPQGKPRAPRTEKQNIGTMVFGLGLGAFGVAWLTFNPDWSGITTQGLPIRLVALLLIGPSCILLVIGLRGFLANKP
jgi:hypothetical protein